jgi:hypothetical protein
MIDGNKIEKKLVLVKRSMSTFLILCTSMLVNGGKRTHAITGDWQVSHQWGRFELTDMFESDTSMVISDLTKGGNQQYLLNHPINSLLGLHDTSVEQIVQAIDADFFKIWQENQSIITLDLTQDSMILGVHHKTYQFKYKQIDIFDAYLKIHESDQQGLVMVRWNTPKIAGFNSDFPKPQSDVIERLFANIQIFSELNSITKSSAKPIYIADNDQLIPAWTIEGRHRQGYPLKIIFHGLDGSILYVQQDEFALLTDKISVYEKNPKDGKMIETDMPLLRDTGYLDSKFFSVFGPKDSSESSSDSLMSKSSTRIRLDNRGITYSAFRPQDTQAFDQLQIYFYAMRSFQWLWEKFGLDPDPTKNFVSIYVGGSINGRYDNAMYLPSDSGSAVLIAQNEKLENLARDRDVVSHELAHHIIYRGIKSSAGESGVLHEGTADYLTYAQSLDPYLAESIVPGAPYLRTALMVGENPSEKLSSKMTNHAKGQYWSALLWDLGEKVGHDRVIQWISGMLHYVSPKAGVQDAFVGIIRAERDLVLQASKEKTDQTKSPPFALIPSQVESQECLILETGIRWGFARFLTDFSGESCGINIQELLEKKTIDQTSQTRRKSFSHYPLKVCGVIGSVKNLPYDKIINNLFFYIIWSFPLVIIGTRGLLHTILRIRRSFHGS